MTATDTPEPAAPARKRVLEERSKAWLGTLAGLTLTALVVATTLVSSLHLGKTTYYADFLQIASVRPGDEVSIAGIPVGTVSDTTLAGDHVEIAMKIDRGVHLGSDTRAAIKLTTVLGSRYIELKPAGDDPLPDSRISLSHTGVPYDLQKLLQDSTNTFGPVDAEQFAESMRTVAGQLHDVPPLLPAALTNVQNLSQVIADRRSQIADLLASTAEIAEILGGQRSDLAALITEGRQLLGAVLARREAVVRLMDAATRLVGVADTVLTDTGAETSQLLGDMRQVTAMLGDHDDLLRNLFQILPITMRNLANATGTGPFLDFALPGGLMVDSWMCAISGRAEQFQWPERYAYFKDCE
ncbi:MCE family protein [Mycobacterium koreense]|uniref:Uncharacterized protein n=1 Tax=Mycolicibacillus koreensis TaxID=1069220 RepID=A0A7I7SFE0_9MYCO|nr:MCE family protein [Mycolicibacillus koreensis]MCV7248014.1 MCE family protein [Mycolicibacillus koreensis]OSC31847.1 hypothetical protein B8W67_15645 [Mycolicibacillus koreensis]BBY54949.1 putative MCE family protein [Mycolicibacillus koreensis]